MKKYLIIIMAALFAVACSDKQEEVAPAPAVEQYQFTVSVNQGESSRAFLQDLAKIFWEIHDKITLYAKSYKDSSKKVELEAQEVSDAAAKFVGTGDKPAATDVFYATYPEDAQLEVNADGDVVSAKFVLPTTQNGVGDSPLMAAKTSEVAVSSMSLTFKPIFAALNIVLNEDVDKIIFTANDGSAVSGDYKYDFANKKATVSGTIKNITVVPTADKRNIVIVVPAMHYAQGFNLEFINSSRDRMLYNYGKTGIDLAIGKYYELGSVNSPITFKPIEVTLGTVETTYENWGKSTINSNAIYTTNNTFSGAVSKSLIEEIGVEYTAQSTNVTNTRALSVAATPFSITPTGLASDIYTVRAYVKLKGLSEKMYSAPKTVGVIDNEVKLSLTTSSSYSTITDSGTSVTKNNNFSLGGDGFKSSVTATGVNKLLVKELALTSSVASSKVADLSTSITKDGLTYDKWTNYPVTTQLTLNNGAVITHATQTAVVTGIPFQTTFLNSNATNVSNAGWTMTNCTYKSMLAGSDHICLWFRDGGSGTIVNGHITSPKFNVPTDVNVTCIGTSGHYCGSSRDSSKSSVIAFGSVANTSSTANTRTVTMTSGNKIDDKSIYKYSINNAVTLSNTNSYVCFYVSSAEATSTSWNVVTWQGVCIKDMTFQY